MCKGATGDSARGRQAGRRTRHRSRCPAPRGAPCLAACGRRGGRRGPAVWGGGHQQGGGAWGPGQHEQHPPVSRLVTEERMRAQSPRVAPGGRPGVCLRTPTGREGRAEWRQKHPWRARRTRGGSGRWPRVQAGRLAREGAGRLARGAGGGWASSAHCCWTRGEAGSWRGTWLSCWKCTGGREGEAAGQRALGAAGQGLMCWAGRLAQRQSGQPQGMRLLGARWSRHGRHLEPHSPGPGGRPAPLPARGAHQLLTPISGMVLERGGAPCTLHAQDLKAP